MTDFRKAQGAILRHTREDLDLPRWAVAAELQVCMATLRSWEVGLFSPTCEDIVKLAEVYQCPLTDLFPKNDQQKSVQSSPRSAALQGQIAHRSLSVRGRKGDRRSRVNALPMGGRTRATIGRKPGQIS